MYYIFNNIGNRRGSRIRDNRHVLPRNIKAVSRRKEEHVDGEAAHAADPAFKLPGGLRLAEQSKGPFAESLLRMILSELLISKLKQDNKQYFFRIFMPTTSDSRLPWPVENGLGQPAVDFLIEVGPNFKKGNTAG